MKAGRKKEGKGCGVGLMFGLAGALVIILPLIYYLFLLAMSWILVAQSGSI